MKNLYEQLIHLLGKRDDSPEFRVADQRQSELPLGVKENCRLTVAKFH
jgi:hypothetical protein